MQKVYNIWCTFFETTDPDSVKLLQYYSSIHQPLHQYCLPMRRITFVTVLEHIEICVEQTERQTCQDAVKQRKTLIPIPPQAMHS